MNAKTKSSTGRRRMKFLPEEDEKLRELVAKYGKSWNDIAKHLQGRNVRQCRERWKHYLSSDRAKSPWSPEEDLLLFQKFMELGPKWTKIAKFFDDRTDIQIKTRWMKRFGGCNPMLIQPKVQTFNPQKIETPKNQSPIIQTEIENQSAISKEPPSLIQPNNTNPSSNIINLNPQPPTLVPNVPTNDSGGVSLPKANDNSESIFNHDHKMLYSFDNIMNDINPNQEIDIFPTDNSDNLYNMYLDF